MIRIHYIQWRATDFLASKISRRPFFEQGIERLITAMICENGGPIELGQMEIEDIAHRGRCGEEEVMNAIDELVSRGIISLSDGLYMVPWLVDEIERVEYRAKVAVENGKKRGKANPSASQQEPSGMPMASQQEPNSNPVAIPLATHAGTHYPLPLPLTTNHNNNPSSSPVSVGEVRSFQVPFVPEAVKEAAAWQAPVNPPPAIDPTTGSTAGKKPANPHCCVIYANGAIATESQSFTAFMAKFPKPDKRKEAADEWNKLMIEGVDPLHITAAVAVEPSLRKPPEERKFLPTAANWLSDKKYLSVPPQPLPEAPKAAPTAEQIAARKARQEAEARRDKREMEKRTKMSNIYKETGNPPSKAQLAQIETELDEAGL